MVPTFIGGTFGNGLFDALHFLIPFWAAKMGIPPTEIGIIVGARYALPCLFSIHGGVLIDRLGARRMCLYFGVPTLVLAPLYPAMPVFPALLALQLILGLSTSLGWIGVQTMVARITRGDTTLLGRFTFVYQLGAWSAPILIGILFDVFGAWGAFIAISLWTGCYLICIYLIPAEEIAESGPRPKPSLKDLVPKFSEYREAFALLAIPAVALSIAVTVVRHTTTPIQGSFYVVYLEGLEMTGTTIGLILAVVEMVNGVAPLASGRFERIVPAHWAVVILSIGAIFMISITPLLGGVLAFLIIAQVLRGVCQGLAQPLLFGMIAKSVPLELQGRSIGLRTTANRIGSTLIPIVMGVLIDRLGIENGFYATGAGLIFLMLVIGFFVRRSKTFNPRA
jgi:MFS family permease